MNTTTTTCRPLYAIAEEIVSDWTPVNFGAVPYLRVMLTLNTMSDRYGADGARTVVAYFLANAGTWRGETARRIKKELAAMQKAAEREGVRW